MTPFFMAARSSLVATILLTTAIAYAGWAGYRLGQSTGEAALRRCEAETANRERERASEAAAALARAQAAERAAAEAIHSLEAQLRERENDLRAALARRASATRACFSDPVRRLLDGPGASTTVPNAAAGVARADATVAAAAGGPGHRREPARATSERAAAIWAAKAMTAYERCRARIDALRQWTETVHGR